MKKLTLGKSNHFFADNLTFSCASMVKDELARIADPLRGAQGGSFEVWDTLAKHFSEVHNQLITMAMAKIC